MNNSFVMLADLMDDIYTLYSQSVEISKEKSDVILKGDTDRLQEIISEEKKVTRAIALKENERLKLVDSICTLGNIDKSDVVFSNIISIAEESMQQRLRMILEKLNNILNEQKHLNELNNKLIKNNLDYINFSMNLIAGAGSSTASYSKKGKAGDKAQKVSFIDAKA